MRQSFLVLVYTYAELLIGFLKTTMVIGKRGFLILDSSLIAIFAIPDSIAQCLWVIAQFLVKALQKLPPVQGRTKKITSFSYKFS
ncbi:hypothetical protein PseudUWO311_22605 [Pseudanabaena sp. UWO311]|uniref:hypothetical protein n=1 Tax=Pseudanabaena sp. UWO311 TaxID=2487337 RepID=UPI001158C804|nr:hypothetical protein [Pseudanabaena sp. UWO311]TYQ23501.1 hypothetical protein PseudUWO311_22605 [Pseudanabaena sp. UWO311]